MTDLEKAEEIRQIINKFYSEEFHYPNSLYVGLSIIRKYDDENIGEEIICDEENIYCYANVANNKLHKMTKEEAKTLSDLGWLVINCRGNCDHFVISIM